MLLANIRIIYTVKRGMLLSCGHRAREVVEGMGGASMGGIGVTGVGWLGNAGQWDDEAKRGIEAVSGTFASGLFPLDFPR